MTDLATIRATIRDVLAHHINLHREELGDLLRHPSGYFALHNRDERLARMIGELATQITQGISDLSELGQAAIAWAKADAQCDALIDQSIALAQKQRALEDSTPLIDDVLGIKTDPLVLVTAKAELASIGKQIATVDNLIAFACADVTKREAQMKLLAHALAEPDPPASLAASLTSSEPLTQEG